MRFPAEHCALTLLLGLSGCALFRANTDESLTERLRRGDGDEAVVEAADVPVRRIARMEPIMITRPADETRIRSQVWAELCESGLMTPDRRRSVNEGGFRVGVSGAAVPWALDSLIRGTRGENPDPRNGSKPSSSPMYFSPSGTSATMIAVPEGSESLVELRTVPGAVIPPDSNIGSLQGLTEASSVRCVFRVRILEQGAGWAQLQFVPELRFGSQTTRYTVEGGDERLPVRQRILPLYDQKFEVRLHTGEAVVIGHEPTAEWSPGRLFFRTESLTSQEETLLVLRLADIEAVQGQRSLQVSFDKY